MSSILKRKRAKILMLNISFVVNVAGTVVSVAYSISPNTELLVKHT